MQENKHMNFIVKHLAKILFWLAVIWLLIIGVTIAANAQELPNAPVHKPYMTHSEMRDATELTVANLLDFTSTNAFLAKDGKEAILPTALVTNNPLWFAYKAGTDAAEIVGEHYADRLPYVQHHKWAKIGVKVCVQLIVAETLKIDVNNYEYASHLKPAQQPVLTAPTHFHILTGGVK
jgi:hypothetical protein